VIIKESIQGLVDEFLHENEAVFLVSLKIGGGNQIEILIDSFEGIKVRDCVRLSRHVEGNLDREEEDFGLQVASAGLEESFKVFPQYQKNVGRKVDVKLLGGQKIEGTMLSAEEGKGIVLETKRREKVGKKKQVIVEQHELDFQQIDQTKIIISF
jgi:ribosome maturation factor RimP